MQKRVTEQTTHLSPLHKSLRSGRLTTILLFLPPALFLFTLLVSIPLVEGAWYSGYKWSGYGEPSDWRGLQNFRAVIGHAVFERSLRNTIIFVLVAVFVQIPVGMAMALMIYGKHWSNTVFRLVFFLPFILAEVATGLIWSFVFDGDYGITAYVANTLETEKIFPLSDRTWALPVLLFVFVWKYFGFHMMIFIAALQNIPRELIEAARIDGAGRLQIVRFVQLPMLRPAIAVSVFFAVVGSLQIFDLIMPMTNGGPSNTTHSLVSYLYTFGLVRLKVGFGAAVGVILFVISFVFAVTYRSTVMRAEAT